MISGNASRVLYYTLGEARLRGATTQLYIYKEPDQTIDSRYGKLKYINFLDLERERITKCPDRVAFIVKSPKGKFGLFVNAVRGEP